MFHGRNSPEWHADNKRAQVCWRHWACTQASFSFLKRGDFGNQGVKRISCRKLGFPRRPPGVQVLHHIHYMWSSLPWFQSYQRIFSEQAFVPLFLMDHFAQEKDYSQNFYTPASLPDLWSWGHSARSSCSQGCGSSRRIYNWWCNRNGHCGRNIVLVSLSTILSP